MLCRYRELGRSVVVVRGCRRSGDGHDLDRQPDSNQDNAHRTTPMIDRFVDGATYGVGRIVTGTELQSGEQVLESVIELLRTLKIEMLIEPKLVGTLRTGAKIGLAGLPHDDLA